MTDHQPPPAVEAIGRLEELARAAMVRHASGNWRADDYNSTWVWGDSLKGGDTHIADVRGWGYLTGRGHGALALPEEEALAAQRNVQRFIAAANPQAILSLIESLRHSVERARVASEYLCRLEGALLADDLDMKLNFPGEPSPTAMAEQLSPGFDSIAYDLARAALDRRAEP